MRATGLSSLFRASPVFNAECYGGWKRDTVRAVDIVTGCLFLIRRQTWDRLGGFDPTFVMYGEEADLCRRAQNIGLRPMITPEAEIVHYGGASEKVRSDKVIRLNRALMTLIRRHFPPWQRPLARWLALVAPLSRTISLDALELVGAGNVESRAAWGEVWRRRSEWRDGYPDRTAADPRPVQERRPSADLARRQNELRRAQTTIWFSEALAIPVAT